MPEIIARRAKSDDISRILSLQKRHHVSNLSEEERRDGFLTTALSSAQLEQFIGWGGVFVASSAQFADLAGYVVAGPWNLFVQWPIFQVMVNRFPLRWHYEILTPDNSFQYGPVCVAPDWRGRGVLQAMFSELKIGLKESSPFGLTFINSRNGRSLAAHTRKLGFEAIDTFEWNANHYQTLAFRC